MLSLGLKLALHCLGLAYLFLSVPVTQCHSTSFAIGPLYMILSMNSSSLLPHTHTVNFSVLRVCFNPVILREEAFILSLGQTTFPWDPLFQLIIVYLLMWLFELACVDFKLHEKQTVSVASYHYVSLVPCI